MKLRVVARGSTDLPVGPLRLGCLLSLIRHFKMPPKPNIQLPTLELNDQIVSDDEDNHHLQDAIDHDDATPVPYRDKETLKFQSKINKLGAYHLL